jgi:hypothetical protein
MQRRVAAAHDDAAAPSCLNQVICDHDCTEGGAQLDPDATDPDDAITHDLAAVEDDTGPTRRAGVLRCISHRRVFIVRGHPERFAPSSAALRDTVSGIAPAVVAISGRPYAIASAKTMP